jgi:hypothetical protein
MSATRQDKQRTQTKREIKRRYLRAEIGLTDAIPELMFEQGMMYGEALSYLMKEPASVQESVDVCSNKSTLRRDKILYRSGLLAGLLRARTLAADGLHVDPSTTLQDYLVAIHSIIDDESAPPAPPDTDCLTRKDEDA